MDTTTDCPLAVTLAATLREQTRHLTSRWLVRIADRVNLTPNRIFPSDDLIDHVPILLLGIADYIEDPARPVLAETPVIAKAMELGALRHTQGFDEHQLLKEYEILGGILFQFLADAVEEIETECTRRELVICSGRLFQAIAVIQQATTTQFLMLARAQVAEREDRLRTFNRTLTHELRNRIGGGTRRVADHGHAGHRYGRAAATERRGHCATSRACASCWTTCSCSRASRSTLRQQRHVLLPEAAQEAARQVRAAARAKNVDVRIDPLLPGVEVSAAAVELCLTNLLANAIKYSDPNVSSRWVEVRGRLVTQGAGPTEVMSRSATTASAFHPTLAGASFSDSSVRTKG
jgi:signal transduction histidine kinase